MQSSILRLLLVSALCVISYVKAENKVTILDFTVDIPSNDVVESWDYSLENNLIGSTVNIKKNCPGEIQADINIYQADTLVNQINKKFKQPMKEFESYNFCESFESQEIDDDCSIGEGEQAGKNCDISDWFNTMSPGKYRAVCTFKQDNDIATVTLNVEVESG